MKLVGQPNTLPELMSWPDRIEVMKIASSGSSQMKSETGSITL